jgi:hypothetical protein
MFALPLFAARGALSGTRIMALLSLDCSGGRNGGRDGRERVGVALESWLLWLLFCEFSKMLLLERFTEPRSAALILAAAPVPNSGLAGWQAGSGHAPHSNPNHHRCTGLLCGLNAKKGGTRKGMIGFHDDFSKSKSKSICLLAI